MKIIFVQNFIGFHFGIMYLSAILKKNGYETAVFIGGLHNDVVKDICEAKPDLIGFTCITGEHRWVKRIAVEIKKIIQAPIIVGGPHPTYFPEMIEIEGIDMICRGEAENMILELVERIKTNGDISSVKGLWVKMGNKIYKNEPAPLTADLDTLPFPDKSIYAKYNFFQKEAEFPVCISRGCPFNCSFCYNAAKKNLYAGQNTVRMRSADNIIAEMKELLKCYPHINLFIFNDDNLGLNDNWFNDFCDKYSREIALPFFASIRADFITEERIKKLKEANCRCLSVGVESGNVAMRQKILKKNISNETYIKAARLIRKYDIKLRISNILFLPGETIEMAFETLALNRQMRPDAPWPFTLQPYPGTEIYRYAVENGFLDKNFSFDDIDPLGMIDSPLVSKLKDGRKIKVLQNLFYYGVKIPGFYYLLHWLVYLPNNFIFESLHRLGVLLSYANYHKMSLPRAFLAAWYAYGIERRKK